MDELTAVNRFLLEVLHDPKRREILLELCYKEGFHEKAILTALETEPNQSETK